MNDPPELISQAPEQRPSVGTRYRRAIIVSIVVHVVGLTTLLFWYLPSKSDQPPPAQTANSQASSAGPPTPDELPKPIENPDVPAAEIQASIESQIEKYEKVSDERKLSELEKNLKRLNVVATEESVREVTSKIADTLGLGESYVPKESPGGGPENEPVEGSFDTKTAQLSDVTRSRDADGRWQYESVLVDAEGRTLKIPMSGSEGETAYNTFEQIRKFPMAAGIYRSVVMPMMQKMIEAGDLAEKAASEAQRVNQEQGESIESGEEEG